MYPMDVYLTLGARPYGLAVLAYTIAILSYALTYSVLQSIYFAAQHPAYTYLYILSPFGFAYVVAFERNELIETTNNLMESFNNIVRAISFFIHRYAFITAVAFLPTCVSAGPDDAYGSAPPKFDGQRSNYINWTILFSAWVLWKLYDCAELIQPGYKLPKQIGTALNSPAKSAAIKALKEEEQDVVQLNHRLYGAVINAMPAWLTTSLHTSHFGNGVGALNTLRDQFDAHDKNDLAATIGQIHKSHIDAKAAISENDLRLQFDQMMVANNAIERAGGTPFEDPVLIAMFDNALPDSYAVQRQLIRNKGLTSFLGHFNEHMSATKAELATRQNQGGNAFATFGNATFGAALPAAPTGEAQDEGGHAGRGRGRGRGRGKGRGTGRGIGKGAGRGLSQTFSMCLRCLMTDHKRNTCTQPPVQCDYCGQDHHSSICFATGAPGGARRDALQPGAERIIRAECQRPQAHAALPAQPHTPHGWRALSSRLALDI